MIHLDLKGAKPIYEQIVDGYQELILRGILQTDEQLPSVRQLAMELSTNPNTVQKAYAQLEREGFLYSVPGRGNFVCAREQLLPQKEEALRRALEDWYQEVRLLGFDPGQIFEKVRGKYD